MDSNRFSEITVSVMRSTERAVLVVFAEDLEVWIPKSQIHNEEDHDWIELAAGIDDVTLEVAEWWLEKEGLL